MYKICKDSSAIWIIVSVVLKSQEKAENHEEDCGIEDFLHIFTQKLCGWTSVFCLTLTSWGYYPLHAPIKNLTGLVQKHSA